MSRSAITCRLKQSTQVRCSCEQSSEQLDSIATHSYLTLLRMGFTLPSNVTTEAVGSYSTISPLPHRSGAVCFLLHFPSAQLSFTARPLTGMLFYGVRTFLINTNVAAIIRRSRRDIQKLKNTEKTPRLDVDTKCLFWHFFRVQNASTLFTFMNLLELAHFYNRLRWHY